MRILVDCDGVLSDFVGGLLHELRAIGAIPPMTTARDVAQYDIGKALGISWETINQIVYRRGFCATLPAYPEAKQWLADLRELADVTIVTAPYKGAREWIGERIWWLKTAFDLTEDEICVWSQKSRIEGDMIIDDAPKHVSGYGDGWLMARPWNADAVGLRRGGYAEILEAVRREC